MEQHVRIVLEYQSQQSAAYVELGQRLVEAVAAAGVGECDGWGCDGKEHDYFLYGRSADELAAVALPLLEVSSLARGGRMVKRPGPPGACAEETIDLRSLSLERSACAETRRKPQSRQK